MNRNPNISRERIIEPEERYDEIVQKTIQEDKELENIGD